MGSHFLLRLGENGAIGSLRLENLAFQTWLAGSFITSLLARGGAKELEKEEVLSFVNIVLERNHCHVICADRKDFY